MILYVNGDSHSLGQDAGGPEFSYGKYLAEDLQANFVCDAVSACDNGSIVRRTYKYLESNTPDFIVIGWSTWEREEWHYDGRSYFVTSSGHDMLPKPLQDQYKQWVINSLEPEIQRQKENLNYNRIWDLHVDLGQRNIPHLFFNCYSFFKHRLTYDEEKYGQKFNFGPYYVNPYDVNYTYYFWCQNNRFELFDPKWHHYKTDAHKAWAKFLLPKIREILTIN